MSFKFTVHPEEKGIENNKHVVPPTSKKTKKFFGGKYHPSKIS
jgi:hypothetical protein